MQATIYITRQVTVKPEAIEWISKCRREKLCVACGKPLYGKVVRGAHEKCWKATDRAIKEGRFSEEQRIAEGKLLPPKRGGRPPSNPVTIEAREALA